MAAHVGGHHEELAGVVCGPHIPEQSGGRPIVIPRGDSDRRSTCSPGERRSRRPPVPVSEDSHRTADAPAPFSSPPASRRRGVFVITPAPAARQVPSPARTITCPGCGTCASATLNGSMISPATHRHRQPASVNVLGCNVRRPPLSSRRLAAAPRQARAGLDHEDLLGMAVPVTGTANAAAHAHQHRPPRPHRVTEEVLDHHARDRRFPRAF